MVSIKEATERAMRFAQEVLGPERTSGVRLEEVESISVDGQDAWLITLSIPDEEQAPFAITLGGRNRQYKSLTVLKGNGEVQSMKIRNLAGA
jgi:hypothetical protein